MDWVIFVRPIWVSLSYGNSALCLHLYGLEPLVRPSPRVRIGRKALDDAAASSGPRAAARLWGLSWTGLLPEPGAGHAVPSGVRRLRGVRGAVAAEAQGWRRPGSSLPAAALHLFCSNLDFVICVFPFHLDRVLFSTSFVNVLFSNLFLTFVSTWSRRGGVQELAGGSR